LAGIKEKMKIYPKDTFEIDTSLTATEIYSVLEGAIEPPKRFRWWSSSGKKYQGEFSHSDFKIWRIISYRNSSLPIIEGRITPSTSGSRIAVTMRLHKFIAVFMAFWLSGASALFVGFVMAAMRGKIEPLPDLLIPLGLLIFGITLPSCSFWWEAKRSKPFLLETFQGAERQPTPG
jgi:hypothetical protein